MEISILLRPSGALTTDQFLRIAERAREAGMSADDYVADLLVKKAYEQPAPVRRRSRRPSGIVESAEA